MSNEMLAPLFSLLPLGQSMPRLIGVSSCPEAAIAEVEALCKSYEDPAIRAGLWLYVDDLERSHEIVQSLETPEGSYWHGIIHRREGDFWNSKYWFRRAGTVRLDIHEYHPAAFVDRVEADHGINEPRSVDLQRKEWLALFQHCCNVANV